MTCFSYWPGSWGEHVVQRYLECNACMGHTTVEHIPDDKKQQKAWCWRSACRCVHQTWSHLKAMGSSHIYQKWSRQRFAASIPESFLGGAERKFSFHFVYWLLWPQLRLNTWKNCRDRMGVTTEHSEVLGIFDVEFRPRSLGLFLSTK